MLEKIKKQLIKEYKKYQMKPVKIKKREVTTYARPSTNAIVVKTYKKGQELTVYPSIKGWYELRPVDTDGIMNTEFIQVQDIQAPPSIFKIIRRVASFILPASLR